MNSVNRVFILGYLGSDPKGVASHEGRHHTTLSLATNRYWRNKGGQLERRTDWHRVSVFGKKGMLCQENLKKGSPVCVEGHLTTYEFEEDGKKGWMTSIMADEVTFLPAGAVTGSTGGGAETGVRLKANEN